MARSIEAINAGIPSLPNQHPSTVITAHEPSLSPLATWDQLLEFARRFTALPEAEYRDQFLRRLLEDEGQELQALKHFLRGLQVHNSREAVTEYLSQHPDRLCLYQEVFFDEGTEESPYTSWQLGFTYAYSKNIDVIRFISRLLKPDFHLSREFSPDTNGNYSESLGMIDPESWIDAVLDDWFLRRRLLSSF